MAMTESTTSAANFRANEVLTFVASDVFAMLMRVGRSSLTATLNLSKN
jgi:hypothetical protein